MIYFTTLHMLREYVYLLYILHIFLSTPPPESFSQRKLPQYFPQVLLTDRIHTDFPKSTFKSGIKTAVLKGEVFYFFLMCI